MKETSQKQCGQNKMATKKQRMKIQRKLEKKNDGRLSLSCRTPVNVVFCTAFWQMTLCLGFMEPSVVLPGQSDLGPSSLCVEQQHHRRAKPWWGSQLCSWKAAVLLWRVLALLTFFWQFISHLYILTAVEVCQLLLPPFPSELRSVNLSMWRHRRLEKNNHCFILILNVGHN